jgi:acetyl-CoA synthetase
MSRNTQRSLRSAICVHPGRPVPNVDDYERLRLSFSWEQARSDLEGLPAGGLNMAHEALDRHVAAGAGDRVALRFLARDWRREDYSYAELARLSGRFANVLDCLGVTAGQGVFLLADRTPATYVALFGTLKAGAVGSLLPVELDSTSTCSQLSMGGARVLVTTLAHYRQRVMPRRKRLPRLDYVLLTDAEGAELPPGTLSYSALLSAADDRWRIPPTRPDAAALLHFTRGPGGEWHGIEHAHEAVLAHYATGRYALDLRAGDIYWCTLDLASAIGVTYGAIAPLVNGVSVIVEQAEFDAARWYRLLQEESVNVWYTTPESIRRLRKAGNALATSFCFSHLRHAATVGEQLDPQSVIWGNEIFCMPIHDTWAQAETGAIMVSNYRGSEVRPGSMGRPVPGVETAIVRLRAPSGGGEPAVEFVLEPGQKGELAIRTGWPSMCRDLSGDAEDARRFVRGWYLTGDLVERDADGWLWFAGRASAVASRPRAAETGRAVMQLPVIADAAKPRGLPLSP